jgi:hypothetical protein
MLRMSKETPRGDEADMSGLSTGQRSRSHGTHAIAFSRLPFVRCDRAYGACRRL